MYKKRSMIGLYTFSLSMFNAYVQEAIEIIREKLRLGLKRNGRKIDMVRFADDITVIAEN